MTPRTPHTNRTSRQGYGPARSSARSGARHVRTSQGVGGSGRGSRVSRSARASVGSRGVTNFRTPRPTARDGAPSALDKGAFTIPNSELVVTRRQLLYGAIGVGALAAASTAATALGIVGGQDEELTILKVPTNAVTSSNALAEIEPNGELGLIGRFEMPYGTLVWCNDNSVAACLVPGESAKPLTQVQLLYLGSGSAHTVVKNAVGQDEGFEIYDCRATSQGVVWVEANILAATWRIYTAQINDVGSVSDPVLADEGNKDWETPSLAVVANKAYWQVLPRADGEHSRDESVLKRTAFGSAYAETCYSSKGRMATPPHATREGVVITPRTDTDTIHYQLTYLDANTNDVLDWMILPQSMKPLEAGYGPTGFTFCFEGIYDYGDGIANLGSYVPMEGATGEGYNHVPWFRWGRTPACAPCWVGNLLMVKSTSAVCGIDFATKTYFALDVPTGADTYGDYLASTGQADRVVTFANVDNHPVNAEAEKYCLVRVFAR